MDKKYELIKDSYWYRVKALKDFTLITGETIKKGEIGGSVTSEECLSQEGSCWIKNYAVVEGKVSGNAVVKDYAVVHGIVTDNAIVKDRARVYGKVSGNAIIEKYSEVSGTVSDNVIVKDYAFVHGRVSGNAVVKDYARVCGIVSENAIVKDRGFVATGVTVTGNAVIQAFQYISYGVVTTDLLGTKDWTGALYTEFAIVPKNGKVTLYKAVWSTDDLTVFKSNHNSNFTYEIGKEAIETDVDEDVMKSCGKGLHFSLFEDAQYNNGDTILECEIDLKDIITVQIGIIRARKCKVIRAYKKEE